MGEEAVEVSGEEEMAREGIEVWDAVEELGEGRSWAFEALSSSADGERAASMSCSVRLRTIEVEAGDSRSGGEGELTFAVELNAEQR